MDSIKNKTNAISNFSDSNSFNDLFGVNADRPYRINMQYDSEAGLLLFQSGSSSWKLLNYLTNNTDGDFIVDFLSVKKFSIPGKTSRIIPSDSSGNPKITFTLNIKNGYLAYNTFFTQNKTLVDYGSLLTTYQRTNVI